MRIALTFCLVLMSSMPALADDIAADREICLRGSPKPASDAEACDRALQATELTGEARAALLAAKARHLFHTGSIPESDAVWQLFVAQQSGKATLWAAYGDNQIRLQRYDSAKAQFEKALALDPASIPAAIGHARVLQDLHLTAEALGEAKALAAKNPANRDALLLEGEMLRADHRFAEAREAYDAILRTEPEQRAALYWRAVSRLNTDDNAGADADMTQFLKQPDCRDIDPFCLAGALVSRAEARQGAHS